MPDTDDRLTNPAIDIDADADVDTDVVIPVVAETLRVDVAERVTGRVRVVTSTETIEREVEETLSSMTVEVTRVPIDRELAAGETLPETRVEANVTVVPVIEERLIVEKRLVLVEEIRIERREETENVSIPVSLRRQRADVERLPVTNENSPSTES